MLSEMRPFGEAKSISGHRTLQLTGRIGARTYVVTLPAFQRCLEDRPDAAERRPTRERITHLRGTRDGHLEAHYDLQATPARPNTGEGNPIGSRRIHSTCLPRFGKDLVFIILESADWRRVRDLFSATEPYGADFTRHNLTIHPIPIP